MLFRSVGPTQRMTTLDWSEHLNVALRTIQDDGHLSEPDFESQLADGQRQRAEFEDYAARTREWYLQTGACPEYGAVLPLLSTLQAVSFCKRVCSVPD